LLLGFPLTYSTKIFFTIAQATDNLRPVAIRVIIAQLGNLALTLLFVGGLGMGAVGSAGATLITFAILYPLFFWPMSLRVLDISWPRFFSQSLVPGLLPSIIASAAGGLCSLWIGDAGLIRLIIGVPICLISYTITWLFVLLPADRADLGRLRKYFQLGRA
jgi:Na+-driven multidrug efflux pump